MHRIVITGGAGFIGSHLCEYFIGGSLKNELLPPIVGCSRFGGTNSRTIGQGDNVICIDNLITGTKDNIRHLLRHPGFRFIKQDITQPVQIDGKVDAILHFASPASPPDYLKYPLETLKVGSFGTYQMLELARLKKARFLLASTSEVYGDPLKHPQPESYWGNVNPIGVRSVYDESKRFAEALTMAYHRYYNVNTHIARIFNTYGPRMRLNDGRALPNFFAQAITGKSITIYGRGTQTRSFCYISDMVDGLRKLLWSNEHQPVNLGNPSEITVAHLAREIKEICHSRSAIRYQALPEDDPKIRQPDISRARKILKWEPKVPRAQGLRMAYQYFRQALKH